MLAAKANNKKNTMNAVVLAVILLVIFFVIYKNLIAGNKAVSELGAVVGADSTVDVEPVEMIQKEEIKLDVLDNEKFLNLVEFKYERKPLDEIKAGKDDPFMVEEL